VPGAAALEVTPPTKSPHASARETPRVQQARALSQQRLPALDRRHLKSVDEAGVNLAMTRLYGRAPAGARGVGRMPQNYGRHVTMLGAPGGHGVPAVMTVEGPPDTDALRAYGKQVLGPTLRPGDVVVMANLRAHRAAGGRQALARRGARLLDLPPSSPALPPIEPRGCEVKTALRKANARARGALDRAITGSLVTITPSDAHGWFRHCGYT
jgi:DDE superfamily endonuclease